jgi:positive regulator of sigma E activity
MAQPRQRSAKDEYYINATSFEVYMIVGLVFLFGFTLAFIAGVLLHMEVIVWPGGLVAAGIGYWLLRVLSKRERAAKIREVDGE